MDLILLLGIRVQWQVLHEHSNEPSGSMRDEKFRNQFSNCQLFKDFAQSVTRLTRSKTS